MNKVTMVLLVFAGFLWLFRRKASDGGRTDFIQASTAGNIAVNTMAKAARGLTAAAAAMKVFRQARQTRAIDFLTILFG